MRRKMSAHVGWGPSGESSVRRPWSEDPPRGDRKFEKVFLKFEKNLRTNSRLQELTADPLKPKTMVL